MILTELGPVTAYRMHTPRWATAPTSGAGAAAHGGGRTDQVRRPSTSPWNLKPLSASTSSFRR